MEAKLRGDSLPQGNTLTPAQQLAIQQAVGRRAQKTANHYQTIYRAIKLRYQIARYDQLPQSLFEDCLKFIETLDLHVPDSAHSSPYETNPTPPYQWIMLTRYDLEALRWFVYAYRHLYKKEMQMFYDFLRQVESPHAGRFYEASNDLCLARIEQALKTSS